MPQYTVSEKVKNELIVSAGCFVDAIHREHFYAALSHAETIYKQIRAEIDRLNRESRA